MLLSTRFTMMRALIVVSPLLTFAANHASSSGVLMRYHVTPFSVFVSGAVSEALPVQTLLPSSSLTVTVRSLPATVKEPATFR